MRLVSLLSAGAMVLCGCNTIGPRTIPRDRFDYSTAVGESWKRQTLLNIVKLRYLDPPIFVDVGQIVAGYTIETSANIGGTIKVGDDSMTLGASTKYTDRPTITYTPLTGNKFIRSLMTPLPPEAVFITIQSGWPADSVLGATVVSLNGLSNEAATLTGVKPADPGFLRVLELLRQIQLSDAVAVRFHLDAAKQQTTIFTFRAAGVSAETTAQIAEVRQLLKLDPSATEFRLVFGAAPTNDQELAVVTRSLMHIMGIMAGQVDVPAADVTEGRTPPGATQKSLRIGCSRMRPANAFVAVAYRGNWFWIDDRDLYTKRAFAFMMVLFTLSDSGERGNLPMLTIPTQ